MEQENVLVVISSFCRHGPITKNSRARSVAPENSRTTSPLGSGALSSRGFFQGRDLAVLRTDDNRTFNLGGCEPVAWDAFTELPIATAALFRPPLPRGLSHFRFLAVKSRASSFWK